MKSATKYLKIWWLMSRNSFASVLMQRFGSLLFMVGKVLRFGFFILFIFFLLKGTGTLAGYNLNQTLFFFLTFNLIDVISQFLFREVYRFRPLIITGDFDLVLVKPVNALFRSLMGGADILDLITIPPLAYTVYAVGVTFNPSWIQVMLYLLLIANGLLIATAFHIAVISFGIITLEVDHTIMIYRDLTNLGRFPVDIYKEPLKGFLTYLIPVGIMITLPAKALMEILSLNIIMISTAVGLLAIFTSMKFWNFALKKYTSASS